jgi:uncharacterized phiE125 gp8 family phage protein
MLTSLQVTTQPEVEPVTVQIARAHCRIDEASDDPQIGGFLTAARIMAEGYLSRVLITQTLLWTIRPQSLLHEERSRLRGELILPRAPVQEILSVTVTDRFGNVTPIQAAALPVPPNTPMVGYIANIALEPGRLRIGPDTPLTGGTLLHWARLDSIQVSFVAGYGDDAEDVPETIRRSILMTTAFLYENRGDAGGEMPKFAEWLLDRHRLQFLGG